MDFKFFIIILQAEELWGRIRYIHIQIKMTTFIKAKLKKTGDQTNIDKNRVAVKS